MFLDYDLPIINHVFIYTRHALSKLKLKDNEILKITKKLIKATIKTGKIIDEDGEVITVLGSLDKEHSLNVVYRFELKNNIIITFFASKKGRYERKILH